METMGPLKLQGCPLALIAGMILLYVAILPWILNLLVGLPFLAKLTVSAALLAPLGFAMGMPFPSGLRALASSPNRRGQRQCREWPGP